MLDDGDHALEAAQGLSDSEQCSQTRHSYNVGAILQRQSFVGAFSTINFKTTPEGAERYQALMDLVRKSPCQASVAATEYLNPHVSTRVEKAEYGLIGKTHDEFYLFKKGAPVGDTAAALSTLRIRLDGKERKKRR